jgi:hypothetical protein
MPCDERSDATERLTVVPGRKVAVHGTDSCCTAEVQVSPTVLRSERLSRYRTLAQYNQGHRLGFAFRRYPFAWTYVLCGWQSRLNLAHGKHVMKYERRRLSDYYMHECIATVPFLLGWARSFPSAQQACRSLSQGTLRGRSLKGPRSATTGDIITPHNPTFFL